MDLGLENMYERLSETRFPWLLTNASFIRTSEKNFNNHSISIHPWHVIQRGELRLGFMGLIPGDWIETLSLVPRDEVEYEDYIDCANRTSLILREKFSVDVIIAITHMRLKDDIRLAEKAKDIDLILGGHDHDVGISCYNNRWIMKSGTDFRSFGTIDIIRASDGSFRFKKPSTILVTRDIQKDIRMTRLLENYSHFYPDDPGKIIAKSSVDLDGRFCVIRSRETALGNLITDISKYLIVIYGI